MSLKAFLKALSIGQMRDKVRIERAVITDDGAGGGTRTWQNVTSVWAKIEPAALAIDQQDRRDAQAISHRIILRWRNDIDTGCRLSLGTRTFVIHAIADADERRRFLIALCEEVRP